jgi:predicted DCC family thiol-disulfide oxidoreductase YuxK
MSTAAAIPSVQPRRGWVLYDGHCRFCTGWIAKARSTLESRGFQPEPLQTPWVNEKLKLPPADLLKDMRVLTVDGRLYNGADGYLYVFRRIWFMLPFGLLFALPGLKHLFAWVYRRVASNRYCIAGQCELHR